jgi:hypothetical protein
MTSISYSFSIISERGSNCEGPPVRQKQHGRYFLSRPVKKNNSPILLVSPPVFFVANHGEYFNIHRIQRLEYRRISYAILGQLIFFAGPNAIYKYANSQSLLLKVYLHKVRFTLESNKNLCMALLGNSRMLCIVWFLKFA